MTTETKSEPQILVRRYSGSARVNHWIVAICFVLLLLGGLSLFHPSLYPVGAILFGGGQNVRWLHPWLGVILTAAFFGLFFRFVLANLPVGTDFTWLKGAYEFVLGHDEFLPEVGKYNAGQKIVFWSQAVLIPVLFITGIGLWDSMLPNVERLTGYHPSIDVRRWAAIIHATAAVLSITVWIIHVYAAIWIRGSFDGMTRGSVTGGWGWRHHRLWLRDQVKDPSQIIKEPSQAHQEQKLEPAE